jgi:hypothetical protein
MYDDITPSNGQSPDICNPTLCEGFSADWDGKIIMETEYIRSEIYSRSVLQTTGSLLTWILR